MQSCNKAVVLMFVLLAVSLFAACGSNTNPSKTVTSKQKSVNSEALYKKGCDYYKGNGVEVDKLKALECWNQAAEAGHAKAQFNLAVSYANADNVIEDMNIADSWLQKAAEQGLSEAKDVLASFDKKKMEPEFNMSLVKYSVAQNDISKDDSTEMVAIALNASHSSISTEVLVIAVIDYSIAARQVAARQNLDPERAGLLAARVIGAATNSQLTRFANVFSFLLNGEDINTYKVDEKYKPILEKIQNRQSLNTEELQILDNKGWEIMNQMSLDANYQSELLNMSVIYNYALNLGATDELARYTYEISRNYFSDQFRTVKATEEVQNKLMDSLFNLYAKNKDIRNDKTGKLLQKELIKETEKAGISTDVIKQLKGMDAQRLWVGANGALQEVANNLDNGETDVTIIRMILIDEIGPQLDATMKEFALKPLLPLSSILL